MKKIGTMDAVKAVLYAWTWQLSLGMSGAGSTP
jgi:hypothetical protein